MNDPVIAGNNSASKYDANRGGSGAIYGNALFEGGVQYTTYNDRTISTQTLIKNAYFNMSPERSKEWNARTILGCDADYRPPLNILCNPEGFQEPEKERDEYLEVLWKLYREERTYMTAKRGPNDPYTLGVQYQIAGIYGRKGNFIRAIIVYRYIFDVSQEHLGGQDPLSIRAIEGLARCFQAQGNHGKASKWVRRLQYLG